MSTHICFSFACKGSTPFLRHPYRPLNSLLVWTLLLRPFEGIRAGLAGDTEVTRIRGVPAHQVTGPLDGEWVHFVWECIIFVLFMSHCILDVFYSVLSVLFYFVLSVCIHLICISLIFIYFGWYFCILLLDIYTFCCCTHDNYIFSPSSDMRRHNFHHFLLASLIYMIMWWLTNPFLLNHYRENLSTSS